MTQDQLKNLVNQELQRKDLLEYVKSTQPDYLAGWFHEVVCTELEQFLIDVEAGLEPRLIIEAPPRHGKSAIVSETFPAWVLGHYASWEIVISSYNQKQANKSSRKVRNLLMDKTYPFQTKISFGNKSVGEWTVNLDGGQDLIGGLRAVGIGTGLTGSGANILVIDDPVKNSKEADSENKRETVKDWYKSVALTRMMPKNGILIIMTRWHEDDLVGWLKNQEENPDPDIDPEEIDKWKVLKFPAIATVDQLPYRIKGEALHPERFPLNKLRKKKAAVGTRVWSALYQQDPVPEGGHIIMKDWLTPTVTPLDVPTGLPVNFYIDGAYGKENSDNSAIAATSTFKGHGFIHKIQTYNLPLPKFIRSMVKFVLDNGYTDESLIRVEPKAIGISTVQTIQEFPIYKTLVGECFKSVQFVAIEPTVINPKAIEGTDYIETRLNILEDKPPTDSKETRVKAVSSVLEAKRVHPVEGPYVESFLAECVKFPKAEHDDQVDILEMFIRNDLKGDYAETSGGSEDVQIDVEFDEYSDFDNIHTNDFYEA